MSQQIKSRKRVVEHGEVFTSEREVSAMVNLVQEETRQMESRFLEIKTQNWIQFNVACA